jgi:hypothetical protein
MNDAVAYMLLGFGVFIAVLTVSHGIKKKIKKRRIKGHKGKWM